MPDHTPDNLTTALAAAPKRGRTPIPDYTPEPLPEIPAEVEARLEEEARTTRAYVRLYQRDANGKMLAIPLNIAEL